MQKQGISISEKQSSDYEESIVACISCGKKIKIVKLKGRDISSFLCQRCAKN